MIIFTGTGRSGIEFYSRLFDTNHQYNVKELARHFPPTNITLDTAPFKDLSTRVKIMRDHLKGVDIKTFRDSSNPYVSFLDALYEIDNNIKIVLGVRDGRAFVRSGITRGYHNENKYSGYSKTPCRDDPYFPLWTNMTPVERMAWMWNFRNSKALECLEHVPKENWMIVRLEDLTANEEKSKYWIEMLEDFLCLKASRGWLKKKCNASKKLEFPPVVEWNKETTQGFDRIAGKLMLTLGYNNKLPDHTINEDKSQCEALNNDSGTMVSIALCVYNEVRFIKETLESLVSQTYKNIEIIAIDNASTDGTWEIIKEFSYRDSRIIPIRHNENKGGLYHVSFIQNYVTGKYYMGAAGHDKWAKDMIEKSVEVLSTNDSVILVAPMTIWIDIYGNVIREEREEIDTRLETTPAGRALSMYKEMQRCNSFFGVHVAEEFRKVLPFPGIIGPDFLMIMRMATRGDIVSCRDAKFYRRKNRHEIYSCDTHKRQIESMKITGLATIFPLLVSRLYIIRELLGYKGTIRDRLRLIIYSLKKLFLNRSQIKLLITDVFLGIFGDKNLK